MSKLIYYYSVMNAGKTTSLLQTNHNYFSLGKYPLIIKPTVDTRDGAFRGWGVIKSRIINTNTQCLYLDDINKDALIELIKYNGYNAVLVDEAQFFTSRDVLALSDVVDELDIPVIAYGLKVDSNGDLFEGSKGLFELADSVRELKQICSCGRKATMHVRFVDGRPVFGGDSVAIEGESVYKSVCRKCWKKYVNERKEK